MFLLHRERGQWPQQCPCDSSALALRFHEGGNAWAQPEANAEVHFDPAITHSGGVRWSEIHARRGKQIQCSVFGSRRSQNEGEVNPDLIVSSTWVFKSITYRSVSFILHESVYVCIGFNSTIGWELVTVAECVVLNIFMKYFNRNPIQYKVIMYNQFLMKRERGLGGRAPQDQFFFWDLYST